jgi:hypothetical protein
MTFPAHTGIAGNARLQVLEVLSNNGMGGLIPAYLADN